MRSSEPSSSSTCSGRMVASPPGPRRRLRLPKKRATAGAAGRSKTSRGDACCTTRPSSITASASPISAASARSWVTKRAVSRHSAWTRLTSRRRPSRRLGSTAPSGSSSSRARGSAHSARASATRCCSPPDSPAVGRSASPGNPTSSRKPSARARRAPRRTPATRNANATFSHTARFGNSRGSWNTTAMPRRWGGVWSSARPSSSTVPAAGRSNPAMARSSVVLPAPDGPTSAVREPASSRRSRPSITGAPPGATASPRHSSAAIGAPPASSAPPAPVPGLRAARAVAGRSHAGRADPARRTHPARPRAEDRARPGRP